MSAVVQHTPGPWEVVNRIDVYPVGDKDGRFYVAHCDPDDAPLASAGFRPGEYEHTDSTYEQQAANARLIAAAPDLLGALALFMSAIDIMSDGPDDSDEEMARAMLLEAADRGKAAIAKAEGRSA